MNIKKWKTITVSGQSGEQLLFSMKKLNYFVSEFANKIILSPYFKYGVERQVDLAKIQVAELGHVDGAQLGRIYQDVINLGLSSCLSDVGPGLRLEYSDQQCEEVKVGMNPIDNEIFSLSKQENVSELHTCCGQLENYWPGGTYFVFEILHK